MAERSTAGRRSTPLLAAAAFIVGMGVMVIEITASRILAPHYGASIFVWTSIIVTVLLALAVGYWAGGNVAEGSGAGTKILGFMLAGAAVLLVAGVWGVGLLTHAISGFLTSWSDAMPFLFAGSLMASFFIFALPVFLLAMSGPVILKAWASNGGDIGKVSGRYFAVSTVGSVVGTLLPTLVTVPMFGAKATMSGVAAIFLVLGAVMAIDDKRVLLGSLVAFPLTAIALPAPATPPGTLATVDSPYQYIRVTEDTQGTRQLVFNEGSGYQSVWNPQEERTGMYFDYMAAVPQLHAVHGERDALVLGLAGGTCVRQYLTGAPDVSKVRMTGVEVDPAVIKLAKEYFAVGDLPVQVVAADGRMYLAATDRSFDDIIVDAYSTQLYIAPHLATREFFDLVRSRLKPGGVVAMNVNAATKDSPLLVTMLNTVSAVFPYVSYVPATHWNYIIIASMSPLRTSDVAAGLPQGYEDIGAAFAGALPYVHDPAKPVFTDDKAPIEMLTDTMIVEQALRH